MPSNSCLCGLCDLTVKVILSYVLIFASLREIFLSVAAFSASSRGCGKAAVQGGAKRLRAGDNTVILGGLLNNRVAFCAGSELPVNFSHGGAHA